MPHGRHLFISDLHLDASAPDAVAQFCRFLQHDARHCDGLYILGDLFETWVGDDDDEPARVAVCEALLELTRTTTPCWVMRGNRDFLLGREFENRTGCALLPDPVLLQLGAVRAVISHGDLFCTADHGYQQFRTLANSLGFQTEYLALPLATRRALAQFARGRSREHTDQMRTPIMDVDPTAVLEALRRGGCDLLIHGHTHRPGIHRIELDGRRATRVVLGDWYDQGSCLQLNADATYELLSLPRTATGSTVSIEPSRLRV
jgi:UDP-2,3-diacylglucosamine hydrolase